MVSQYFFCPSGCLHKFVISFATQYVSARVATVPEKNQPLTYTILHFSLGSNRAHNCITAGKYYPNTPKIHPSHFTCLIQPHSLIPPCSSLSGTFPSVSYHAPATNIIWRAGGHRDAFGAVVTTPGLYLRYAWWQPLHCASTFSRQRGGRIVLSAPSGGTRSHVHSFLSPVA